MYMLVKKSIEKENKNMKILGYEEGLKVKDRSKKSKYYLSFLLVLIESWTF